MIILLIFDYYYWSFEYYLLTCGIQNQLKMFLFSKILQEEIEAGLEILMRKT